MSRSVVLVLFSLAIVGNALFTAEDARRRQDAARADRAPVDELVEQLTAAVGSLPADQWAAEDCFKHVLDQSSAPWKTILEKYDIYRPILAAALNALGYRVQQVVKQDRIGSCFGCSEAGFCPAVACRTPASITICWRDDDNARK
jgi:hypothetical protein